MDWIGWSILAFDFCTLYRKRLDWYIYIHILIIEKDDDEHEIISDIFEYNNGISLIFLLSGFIFSFEKTMLIHYVEIDIRVDVAS